MPVPPTPSSSCSRLAPLRSLAPLLVVGLLACGDDSEGAGGGGGATTSASASVSTSSASTATVGAGGASSSAASGTGGAGGDGAGGDGAGGGGTGTGGAGGQGTGGAGGGPGRYDALIASIEAELEANGAPGAAVAILEGGELTFARGFGTKVPGEVDPVLPTTSFRIGSVTKVITAATLLTEVERGGIDLDEPITTYVPALDLAGVPGSTSDIQVRHLLTHAAGLRDYLVVDAPLAQQADAALASYLTGPTFASAVQRIAPAGAFFNYSNSNYFVAGLVAETASATLYRDLVRERLLAPLTMDRSFFLPSEVIADGDYAIGRTTYFGAVEDVAPDSYENAWARPAGYLTSNVLDMAKFAGFLLNGDDDVLAAELREEMQSAVLETREFGGTSHYGYGLHVNDGLFLEDAFHAIPIVGHEGYMPGFTTQLITLPSEGFAFIAFVSSDHYLDVSFRTALSTLVDLPAATERPDVSITAAERATFVGSYQDDYNVGPIVVSSGAFGRLDVQMPLLDDLGIPYQTELEHYADETFVLGIQGTSVLVSFLPDENGDVRFFRTRPFVGIRAAANVVAAPLQAPPTAPEAPLTVEEKAARRARILASLAAGPRGVPVFGPPVRAKR